MIEKEIVNDYYRLPKIILILTKTLHLIHPYLASRLLLFFFTRPIYFKTPERELEFLKQSEFSRMKIPDINKNIQIYNLKNQGEKILLVHGWNGRGSQFHHIAKICHNAGFDVTVFDLPGHGKSSSKRCNVSEVVSCINHLNHEIGPFNHLISHSVGAIAALNSVNINRYFKSIVIISLPSLKIRPMFTNFVNMFDLPGNKYTDIMVKYYEKKYRMQLSSLDPIEFAKKISVKSLIVHCKDDRDADVHLSQELHKEIPNSKIFLTENLGHRRILRDPQVSQRIVDFLL
jgi:pimeloyl-ACP methyl ester carboxylesterase